jgi:hypothetical protein
MTMTVDKVLYIGQADTTGSRNGASRSSARTVRRPRRTALAVTSRGSNVQSKRDASTHSGPPSPHCAPRGITLSGCSAPPIGRHL